MAEGFEKGNQFWKQRSKHGRDLLFASPTLLWESACEYFHWCESNPLIETVHDKLKVNGEGDKLTFVELPKLRPFTMHGLCIFLDCSTSYFRTFKSEQKEKHDFLAVITRIEEIIYEQKFVGATTGFFNPNIIARDLGLSEKTTAVVEIRDEEIDYEKLSDAALEEIANAKRG